MQEPQVLEPDDNPAAATTAAAACRSTIDTSRPFRSVKEAVAVFGERFLVGEIYNPKPFTFPKKETPFFSPSPSPMNSSIYSYETTTPLSETVKKLEAELEDTKNELKLLKERESETEVALASLNAEIHKNMSKLQAEAEVATAGRSGDVADGASMVIREEEKKRDAYLKGTNSKKLAQILSIGEEEGLFVGRKKEKKVMKKKPIVPLVGSFFSRRKGASTASSLHSPLHWNI
ncbi:WEB family protein at1g75720 [Phtheirospermum japonicum]|uniref:WEB family protein at1g75720 n=1 Tax=Phtheirospermum japonicum TaxID=374723 RepID=A0A830CQQ7_9LAMI|nr:WEB family protein at1g75720 [Phtheirospermum japonicum]